MNCTMVFCKFDGCYTQASFGLASRKKEEFCSKHASKGMVNVKHKKCSHRECSKHPSYGDAHSATAKLRNARQKRDGLR